MAKDENKSVAELAVEIKTAFEGKLSDVRDIAEKAVGMAEKGEKATDDFKEKADEALTGVNELKANLDALEQKLARGGDEAEGEKSFGDRFVESDEFKAFSATPRNNTAASMDIKADITTATSGDGGVGAAIAPNRLPGVQALPQRRMTIRDLLMPGRTDSPSIEYVRETGFTNNADMKGEGALAAQSDIKFDDMSTRTKVISHFFRISKETLSDVSQIRSIIDNRLLHGLAMKEENQLLHGDNTGENLHGIAPQATGYASPLAIGDETSIDKIRLMILQAVLAEYPATGIVLNPIDWAWIETLKDTTGRYIIGNPQGSHQQNPVVACRSLTYARHGC